MDNLNLFGALVTNGQEELASLANLITIRFAEYNKEHISAISAQWQQGMAYLAEKHAAKITGIEGRGLLTALVFSSTEQAVKFGKALGERYRIDAGVQTYKADCPPAVLNKLPLISTKEVIAFVINAMDELLTEA
jgi:acetylornithine/succinyldiaminopimelate/putrescine aminotransferase